MHVHVHIGVCVLVQNKINHSLSFLMDATLYPIPLLLQAFSHIPNCPVFFFFAYLPDSSSAHRKISGMSVTLFI